MRRLIVVGALALIAGHASAQEQKADSVRIHQLQEVAVLATRATKQTPMSYSNIKKEELKKINLGQDVPYLLQLQPSVVATSDAGTGIGYTGIRVRGVDATGTNVTANGVPINDSESQGVFWVNMPDLTSSVEEMQLQRGIGTSSNGAGSFGASLNLRTSNLSTKPYAEVGFSAGSFSTMRTNLRAGSGTIANHFAFDARLSKIDSKGYVDRGTVDLKSYFVQAGYFKGNSILKFISFGGKEVTGIAWNGISESDIAKYGRTYNSAGDMLLNGKKAQKYYHNTDNYQQIHNHLIFTHRINKELALNITGHYTAGYGYTNEYRTGRKLVEYGLKTFTDGSGAKVKRTSLIRRKYLDNDFAGIITNLNITLPKLNLLLGASANHYHGKHYGELPLVEQVPYQVDPQARYYDGIGSKTDLSVYAKLNYQITANLSAYADLQGRLLDYRIKGTTDGFSESGEKLAYFDLTRTFSFFNPKAGLFWHFAPQHHLYASVAVAHREPNRKMYTDNSNPGVDPRPEQMTDYELGYGFSSKSFKFSANMYYMDYKDQLVMNGKLSDVGDLLLVNIPKSYRLGVEMAAVWQVADFLRLDYTLALSRNKIQDYTNTLSVYDANWDWQGTKDTYYKESNLSYSPSVVSSGAITFTKGKLEASLTGQYVGQQYLDNTSSETATIPAYQILHLRLGYDLSFRRIVKNVNLSLQVNNLLNTQYHSNAYIYDSGIDSSGKRYSDLRLYPQAGINFLAGATVTF